MQKGSFVDFPHGGSMLEKPMEMFIENMGCKLLINGELGFGPTSAFCRLQEMCNTIRRTFAFSGLDACVKGLPVCTPFSSD